MEANLFRADMEKWRGTEGRGWVGEQGSQGLGEGEGQRGGGCGGRGDWRLRYYEGWFTQLWRLRSVKVCMLETQETQGDSLSLV